MRKLTLTTCSLCLRVRRGSGWIEAERAIGELRSYDLAEPPRLAPGLCDACVDSLFIRRASLDEQLAA
jgi:hypothetical protein